VPSMASQSPHGMPGDIQQGAAGHAEVVGATGEWPASTPARGQAGLPRGWAASRRVRVCLWR
jgi:hypothetical protein